MRILVAGGAGAIGRHLVPMLVARGHHVIGTTRSPERATWLASVGAVSASLDLLDPGATRELLALQRPEVVVHQVTDFAAGFGPEQLARTALLREAGTRTLVDAAVAAGVDRVVAQSGAWLYADGEEPHDETHPLREPSADPDDVTLRGIRALEAAVLGIPGIGGTVLRYGFLYGPGTDSDRDAAPAPRVDVRSAARATVLAVEREVGGPINVVDDDPSVSNARARAMLDWAP
jgi:nucleoside-diphosphate-sugar epimerase